MAKLSSRNNKDGTLIYYGDFRVAGNRIRKTLGSNRKVAELKLKKLEYELTFQSLKEPERSKIQFHHALIQFLKELESSGIKSEQIYVINRKVFNFTTYCNGLNIKYIQDVTPIIAKQYIALRTKTRLYNKYKSDTDSYVPMILPRTINREIQMLTRFYKFCIEADWMDNNPFYNVKRMPLKQDRERFYFSENDVKLIFNTSSYYYDFYFVLLNTGIRSTDAYSLKPEHIKENYLVKQMNKTGDWLNIPLPANTLQIIDKLLNDEFIFPELQSPSKRRKCTEHLQSNFETDFVRKNNINLHTFRHTYAHNMLNKGVPKEVLQTLLGHRSIKTTEIYANWVRKEELEKWV